jgi:hypothetical protein
MLGVIRMSLEGTRLQCSNRIFRLGYWLETCKLSSRPAHNNCTIQRRISGPAKWSHRSMESARSVSDLFFSWPAFFYSLDVKISDWHHHFISDILKMKTCKSFSINIKTIQNTRLWKQAANAITRLKRAPSPTIQGPWGVYSNRDSSMFYASGERQQENAPSNPSKVLHLRETTHGYANTKERNTVMKSACRRGLWVQPIEFDS